MSSEQVFLKEAKIMKYFIHLPTMTNRPRQLRHPNIVQFMGVCLEKPDLCIITEFLERGSLFEILIDPSYVIEEEHIRGVVIYSPSLLITYSSPWIVAEAWPIYMRAILSIET